jgi:hypothetical protein
MRALRVLAQISGSCAAKIGWIISYLAEFAGLFDRRGMKLQNRCSTS